MEDISKYYYEQSGQQMGPVIANQLVAQGVTASTLVWREGMAAWVPAASIPELIAFFQPVPPLPSRATSNLMAPAVDQLASLLFTTGQERGLPAIQVTTPPVTGPRPQFSAEVSKYRWWHYIILGIVVIMLMLLARACGAILEHAITIHKRGVMTGNLAAAMSALCFYSAGFLSTVGVV